MSYIPLNLSRVANAGIAALPPGAQLPTGACVYRGIPFEIPATPDRCALVLGDGAPARSATIVVGEEATYLIFVHRLLDSRLHEGDPAGRCVAHYIVQYADGGTERAQVRERFEIGFVPCGWGELCFQAWPDVNEILPDRFEGRYDMTGLRQCEVQQAFPQAYYLWPWQNPHPERRVAAILVESTGPRILVAAITRSTLAEFPFPLAAAEDVRVLLRNQEQAAKHFDLAVDIDRGVAGFPYPLPAIDNAAYLTDAFRGWGQQTATTNASAYVKVTGIPSATLRVRSGEQELGSANWGELQKAGAIEPNANVRVEIVDKGKNWVHTTVVDDATGKPVPCRVHFRTPAGIPYQPHGHHTHVNSNMGTWHIDIGGDVRLGQISYAYISGKCQGWLPRGEVVVDVARGHEYTPLRTTVQIAPGQRTLELRLKRMADMNAERYFSGDTHVHFLSTQGAHTEAQGEDLNVVNLLLSQWGHLFTNTEEFTGGPSTSPDGRSIVYATQENRQHILGHLTLLGLKEPVMPWCSDGPSEDVQGGGLETTLSRWADDCHAQGGTVIIPHIPNPNCETAALIATGRADAAEMLIRNPFFHIEYYRYLNCGYKLPLVGGTDKMTSDVPVGIYRTYVHIPADEEFTYANWCRNLSRGNTFHSGGPLLRFKVEGQPIGSTIRLPGNGGHVELEAEALSIFPIHSLQIVQEGKVVAQAEEAHGAHRIHLKTRIPIKGHSWLAARCGGSDYFAAATHHDGWQRGLMAHTSPVYIACGGDWWMFNQETANYMITLAEGGISHIRRHALLDKPERTTHHHGMEDHVAFLESPFKEAIAAIHKRMHLLGIKH